MPKKKSRQTTLRSKRFGRRVLKASRRQTVLKASRRQTGTSNIERDRAVKAMQPGKRRSKHGRIYYEHRRNRSDLRGRRV